ncbi:recombination-associated protein RdgC [Flagellatimonas centrodinii]|uniref:recombination-associated protein RdgC n=1 Tax=Flagellatimonas centrodinii TaxID=2806210 RepID=UPI001FED73F1|nr:recombination-associated protein RdgC [Flagellatimonas centrodinii]ULQ45602.1 recombination-associated protein RdgC [Flagellatimonas centrodinii]
MWFKNLCVFQLEQPWTLPPGALETLLAQRPLVPCPAMSPESTGWVAPGPDGALVASVEKHLLVALGWETRLLPGAVINDAAAERAEAFEQQRGFKPGRKLMRDIKDAVAAELLPKAFTRRSQLLAWIDPEGGRIVVDTGTVAKAETLIQHLRDALGSLAVVPWTTEVSPASTMTQWLLSGDAPSPFDLGDACELSGSDDTKSVIRYVRHPLEAATLKRHLDDGMRATQVALHWSGQLTLTLTEPLVVRKVKFLEAESEDTDRIEDPDLAFEADFTLMVGAFSKLLADLERVLAPAG